MPRSANDGSVTSPLSPRYPVAASAGPSWLRSSAPSGLSPPPPGTLSTDELFILTSSLMPCGGRPDHRANTVRPMQPQQPPLRDVPESAEPLRPTASAPAEPNSRDDAGALVSDESDTADAPGTARPDAGISTADAIGSPVPIVITYSTTAEAGRPAPAVGGGLEPRPAARPVPAPAPAQA